MLHSGLVASLIVMLILLLICVTLLFMQWRKQKQFNQALEQFVDDIKDTQSAHGKKLNFILRDNYHLDKQSAEKLAQELLASEKQFVTTFVALQLQRSYEGLYVALRELLYQYLSKPVQPDKQPEETKSRMEESRAQAADDLIDDNVPVPPQPAEEPVPDWGDVFD
jgi:hypothetical protein